jgi:hypothetical protein
VQEKTQSCITQHCVSLWRCSRNGFLRQRPENLDFVFRGHGYSRLHIGRAGSGIAAVLAGLLISTARRSKPAGVTRITSWARSVPSPEPVRMIVATPPRHGLGFRTKTKSGENGHRQMYGQKLVTLFAGSKPEFARTGLCSFALLGPPLEMRMLWSAIILYVAIHKLW